MIDYSLYVFRITKEVAKARTCCYEMFTLIYVSVAVVR